MNYRILRSASVELEEAVFYYNQQVLGLGYEFASEFTEAIDRIRDFPDAWPMFDADVRRYRLARFPYGILYHISDDTLLILGLMHLAMNPTPWRERLRDVDSAGD